MMCSAWGTTPGESDLSMVERGYDLLSPDMDDSAVCLNTAHAVDTIRISGAGSRDRRSSPVLGDCRATPIDSVCLAYSLGAGNK